MADQILGPDINSLRLNIEGALKDADDAIYLARGERDEVAATISQLEQDRVQLIEMQRIASGKPPKSAAKVADSVGKPKAESKRGGRRTKISPEDEDKLMREMLKYIRVRQGDASGADIAENTGVSPVTVSSCIAQFVDKGLVRIEPSQADKRKKLVSLTVKGGVILDGGAPVLTEVSAFPAKKDEQPSQEEATSQEDVSGAMASAASDTEGTESDPSAPEFADAAEEEIKPIGSADQQQQPIAEQNSSEASAGSSGGLSGYAQSALNQDESEEAPVPVSEEAPVPSESSDEPVDGSSEPEPVTPEQPPAEAAESQQRYADSDAQDEAEESGEASSDESPSRDDSTEEDPDAIDELPDAETDGVDTPS